MWRLKTQNPTFRNQAEKMYTCSNFYEEERLTQRNHLEARVWSQKSWNIISWSLIPNQRTSTISQLCFRTVRNSWSLHTSCFLSFWRRIFITDILSFPSLCVICRDRRGANFLYCPEDLEDCTWELYLRYDNLKSLIRLGLDLDNETLDTVPM